VLGQKSAALYLKADCVHWFNKTFGASHPDAVQALLDLGFPRISPVAKKKKPLRRGVRNAEARRRIKITAKP